MHTRNVFNVNSFLNALIRVKRFERTSVGEKPIWLGQPQPILAQPKMAQPKFKKNLAGPIMAGPNFWLGQSMTQPLAQP